MISDQDRFNAAVFVQFLEEELDKQPEDIQDALCETVFRFSPAATPHQVNACVGSVYETITDEEGELLPNWRDLIIEEHAA